MGKPVTDPALLAALNAQEPTAPATKAVTDPALLAQLNGTEDTDPDHKPVEERTLGDAFNYAGRQFKEGAQSVGKFITTGAGQLAGDVSGLSALAAKLLLQPSAAARTLNPDGVDPGASIDPAAVRDKVASAIATKGAPGTFSDKVVSLPGEIVGGAGNELVNLTGTENTPVISDILRAAPAAALAFGGIRASKEPAAAVTTAAKEMTPAELHQSAVKTLLDNGVRLKRDQRSTSVAAKQATSVGRAADTMVGKSALSLDQMHDFTAAVLNKVGIKARNVTPDAMLELKRSTEQKYDTEHNRSPIKVDSQLAQDLLDIKQEANQNPYVTDKFDKMLEHIQKNVDATPAGPTMAPEAATRIRAQLGKIQGGNDSNLNSVARDIQNAIDEAAARSAPPAEAAAMRDARKQFHFMKQIEGAVDPKGGFISPRKLLNSINTKRNRNEAMYGQGDQELVTLAKAGAKILPEAVGDSGTATRLFDVAKWVADPKSLAKTVGGALGGRLINESGAARGTPAGVVKAADRAMTSSRPAFKLASVDIPQESPEQKKRRLQAAALKAAQ